MTTDTENIKANTDNNYNDMTVSELFEAWLSSRKGDNAMQSPRVYFLYYMAYVKPVFGERRVNDLTYIRNGVSSSAN